VRREQPPFARRHRAAPPALEQTHAQNRFQLADGLRHRRLRDRQLFGGALQRSALRDRDEAVQMTQLDTRTAGRQLYIHWLWKTR